jgi:hypothetical protein
VEYSKKWNVLTETWLVIGVDIPRLLTYSRYPISHAAYSPATSVRFCSKEGVNKWKYTSQKAVNHKREGVNQEEL